jgi:hypothetical protein
MTVYREFTVKLSDDQKQKVAKAIKDKETVTIQVDPSQHGNDKLLITETQANQLMKAKGLGKEQRLALSKSQLGKQKGMAKTAKVEGGFAWLLPLLAAAAVPALSEIGKYAGQKAVDGIKKLTESGAKGSGLIAPGAPRTHSLKKGQGLIAAGKRPH